MTHDCKVSTLSDLPQVAERILEHLNGRRVLAFYGAMGAGKTTLIRAICDVMQVQETVNSPTFALVNAYHTEGGLPIYHFDFYRIQRLEEAFDFGYEEYFFSGDLCLVEWPERIEPLLPDDVMRIELEVTGTESRVVRFSDE